MHLVVRERAEPCRDIELVDLIPALRAFSRTFHRNTTDAEDLVQETLVKGIANITSFEPGTRMKSWLFTIMRNTFNTRYRQTRRESPGASDCASARPYTADNQDWVVRGREFQEALNRLPSDQREMLVLVCVLGTSYTDAAAICGCGIGTVKSRISRGRLALLHELGEPSVAAAVEGNTRLRTGYLAGAEA